MTGTWDEGKTKDARATHNNGPCRGHCDRPASYNEAQLVSSCPIRKLLCRSENPPPEPLLVFATFNGRIYPHRPSFPHLNVKLVCVFHRLQLFEIGFPCHGSFSSLIGSHVHCPTPNQNDSRTDIQPQSQVQAYLHHYYHQAG